MKASFSKLTVKHFFFPKKATAECLTFSLDSPLELSVNSPSYSRLLSSHPCFDLILAKKVMPPLHRPTSPSKYLYQFLIKAHTTKWDIYRMCTSNIISHLMLEQEMNYRFIRTDYFIMRDFYFWARLWAVNNLCHFWLCEFGAAVGGFCGRLHCLSA